MKRVDILLNGEKITEVDLANRYFLRLRGLIGRDPNRTGGLLIKPCGQIHTCFMSCAIDAVYIGRNGTVLQVDESIPAFQFCAAVSGSRTVLELPTGKAAKFGIKSGAEVTVQIKKKMKKLSKRY